MARLDDAADELLEVVLGALGLGVALGLGGGDDLVDGLAGVDVGTRSLAWFLRAQERRSDPVIGAGYAGRRFG